MCGVCGSCGARDQQLGQRNGRVPTQCDRESATQVLARSDAATGEKNPGEPWRQTCPARCTCGTPVAATQIRIILPFAQEWLIILPLNVLIFQALFTCNLESTYFASINLFDVPYQLHLCWEVVLCLDQLP